MDFGVVGFDSSILCSNSNNNVSFALDTSNNSTDEAHQLHKWFGSGHSKQEKRTTGNEDGGEDVAFREYKVAKTNSLSACGEQMLKNPFFQRSNNGDSNVGEGCNQQMLSFSSQNVTSSLPPYYHRPQNISGLNGANMEGIISSVRAPFTPSQRVELHHQAMIFKYIIANVPVPPNLLIPIRKAFESAAYSCYSGFKSNPLLGWGTLHLGFSNNNDPEPGRCRRTDGKKWRCSRDAVGDQKYCERHMNRGRHRSRKPVEAGQNSQPSNRKTTLSESEPPSVLPKGGGGGGLGLSHPYAPLMPTTNRNLSGKEDSKGRYQHKETSSSSSYSITKHQNPYQEASDNGEFGLVCSDSLLNPINPSSSLVAYATATSGNLSIHDEAKSGHFLRQFIDDWPKNLQHSQLSDFMSSTLSPKELDMGLSVGGFATNEQNLKSTNCVQASWETSMGGPLGEVLHANIGECKNSKPGCSLNLMVQNWDNSNNNHSYLASSSSSPTGVLQRPELNSVSNSSAGSSPRGESEKTLDANSLCNRSIFGNGTM